MTPLSPALTQSFAVAAAELGFAPQPGFSLKP